jgi:16S rRNA (cytosine967-C5)-methyltransferase
MAQVLSGRGRVYAYDVSERKLKALARRASRAGVYNIQTAVVAEGAEEQLVDKFAGTADVVLVDAPCTGWGVLRRNPDIKWRQQPEELERLPQVQQRILGAYSRLIKPGGRLVYGVCTFRREETEDVVSGFLAAHPEFTRGAGGYLGPGPCDGFYMCELIRNS